jgi:hypothetical protein
LRYHCLGSFVILFHNHKIAQSIIGSKGDGLEVIFFASSWGGCILAQQENGNTGLPCSLVYLPPPPINYRG